MRQLLIAVYLSDEVDEDFLVAQLAELAATPGVVLHRLDSVEMFEYDTVDTEDAA